MSDAPDLDAFDARARADGFQQVLDRDWGANEEVLEHSHPFDARAVLTRGEMWLAVDGGESRHLKVGDGFDIPAGTRHRERYGDHGATYRVARREPPA